MPLHSKRTFKSWGNDMVAGIGVICRSKIPVIPIIEPDIAPADLSQYDYDFVLERQTIADHDEYLKQKQHQQIAEQQEQQKIAQRRKQQQEIAQNLKEQKEIVQQQLKEQQQLAQQNQRPGGAPSPSPEQLQQPSPTLPREASTSSPIAVTSFLSAARPQPSHMTTSTTSLPATTSLVSGIRFCAPPPPHTRTTPVYTAVRTSVGVPSGHGFQPQPPLVACHLISGQVLQPDKISEASTKTQLTVESEAAAESDQRKLSIVRDFDVSNGENPFDAVELKTINELEELSSVLRVYTPATTLASNSDQQQTSYRPVTSGALTTTTPGCPSSYVNPERHPTGQMTFSIMAVPPAHTVSLAVAIPPTGIQMTPTIQAKENMPFVSRYPLNKTFSSSPLPDITTGSTVRFRQQQQPQPLGSSVISSSSSPPYGLPSPRISHTRPSSGYPKSGPSLGPNPSSVVSHLLAWIKQNGLDSARTRRLVQLSHGLLPSSQVQPGQSGVCLEVARRRLMDQLRTVAVLMAEPPEALLRDPRSTALWEEAAINAAVVHWTSVDKARALASNIFMNLAVRKVPGATAAAANGVAGSAFSVPGGLAAPRFPDQRGGTEPTRGGPGDQ